MVMNVGALKSRDYRLVERDIAGVVEASHPGGALVKVIIEAALLTDDEKVKACVLARAAGADFVKTSTGFGPGGATAADVALMRRVVGPGMGVKAAGGVRDLESAKAMIAAGADRIGASVGVKIVQESRGAKPWPTPPRATSNQAAKRSTHEQECLFHIASHDGRRLGHRLVARVRRARSSAPSAWPRPLVVLPTKTATLRAIKTSSVLVARREIEIIGTVRLEAKKPWAIDVRYFSRVPKAVYLHDLAVAPRAQGKGVGRLLVEQAKDVARAWPSNAIRLDVYDHPAGAGTFYAKCGFREVGKVTYRGVPLSVSSSYCSELSAGASACSCP